MIRILILAFALALQAQDKPKPAVQQQLPAKAQGLDDVKKLAAKGMPNLDDLKKQAAQERAKNTAPATIESLTAENAVLKAALNEMRVTFALQMQVCGAPELIAAKMATLEAQRQQAAPPAPTAPQDPPKAKVK